MGRVILLDRYNPRSINKTSLVLSDPKIHFNIVLLFNDLFSVKGLIVINSI